MRRSPRRCRALLALGVCSFGTVSTSLVTVASAQEASAAVSKPVIHRFVATKQSDTLVEFQSRVTGARRCVLSSAGISGPGIHAVLCSSLKVTFLTLPPSNGSPSYTYTLYALSEHGGGPASKSVKVAPPATLTTSYLTNVQSGGIGSAQFVVPAGESLALSSVTLQSIGQGSPSNVSFSIQTPAAAQSASIINISEPSSAPYVYNFKKTIVVGPGSVLATTSGCDQGFCTVSTVLSALFN